ncbi:MAG: type II secretion system protein [Verrucomicrobiota bacterium JB024]|nr:type II secretion system protein [Verrucomicrobiota bacterium JB024]
MSPAWHLYPLCSRRRGVARRGFSLIELLAVIAVISLLATLSFSVSGKIRRAAQSTTCVSNLRQLGALMLLYAQENGNRLPPSYNPSLDNYHSWPYALLQMGGHEVIGIDSSYPTCAYRDQDETEFKCPTLSALHPAGWLTYSMNHSYDAATGRNYFREGLPVAMIAQPSQQIVLVDGAKTATYFSSTLDNLRNIGTFHGDSDATQSGAYQLGQGEAHILCLDGHVDTLTREQISTGKHNFIFNPVLNN